MTATIEWDSWQLQEEADRRFRRLAARLAVPFFLVAIAIPYLPLVGLERGGGVPADARYAELLASPGPAVPIEEPKPAAEQPKTPVKPQLTEEQKVARARTRASKMLESLDQLADLRDTSIPTTSVQQAVPGVLTSRVGDSGAIARSAQATSGGIGEVGRVERTESGTGLGERRTTTVKSPLGSGADQALAGQGGKNLLAGRTLEEIQLVLDRNKGAFYAIYNRALRDHPGMQGKIVMRTTIAPSGIVTACTLVSSDLRNPELEKKVVQRMLLLSFGAKQVPEMTIDIPITLFPAA